MNSKVLNGSQRVVIDGVISDEECQELQRLTNVRVILLPSASLLVVPVVLSCHLSSDAPLP